MGVFGALDSFAPVSRDMSKATPVGGTMTLVAGALCTVLFLQHVTAALYETKENAVRILDSSAFDIDINLDVTMFDLPCEHVGLGVWDMLGADLVSRPKMENITADHLNGTVGQYSDEEVELLEMREEGKDAAKKDASLAPPAGDVGAVKDLEQLVAHQDYTMIFFSVGWCRYCRAAKPYWNLFVSQVKDPNSDFSKTATDKTGAKLVHGAYAVDCDQNPKFCKEQGASAYPTFKLYRGARASEEMPLGHGISGASHFTTFIKDKVKTHVKVVKAEYHRLFDRGCRLKGVITVPAVPGTVRIGPKAQSTDDGLHRSLNPRVVNVSHHIHHFSFGANLARRDASQEALENTDWRVAHLHEAPVHFVNVVSSVGIDSERTFSMTHTQRVARVAADEVPLVKIHYDLSPIEVVHFSEGWTFYHFVTSVLAVVGGSYSVVEVGSHMLNAVQADPHSL